MSGGWDVSENDLRVEVTGTVRIGVFSRSTQVEESARQALRHQTVFWNGRRETQRIFDGRSGRLTFRVVMINFTDAGRARVDELVGEPLRFSRGRLDRSSDGRVERLGRYLRRAGGRSAFNVFLAGEGASAFTAYGCVVLYPESSIRADFSTVDHRPAGQAGVGVGYTAAHEIGHLFGYDERYFGRSSLPGWQGNIMGAQSDYRYLRHDGWDHSTNPATALVRVIARPWLGGGQVRALIEHVLRQARSSGPTSLGAPSSELIAHGTHAPRFFITGYRDARRHRDGR